MLHWLLRFNLAIQSGNIITEEVKKIISDTDHKNSCDNIEHAARLNKGS